MSDQSKIKAKIAALLAKAKGTDNEHEAGAFLAKAMELLDEHQLTMADLDDANDPVERSSGLDGTKWVASWQRDLFRALGKLYGCYSVKVNLQKGYRQELVGRQSSIVTTELMFDYARGECNRLGRELYRQGGADSAAQGARLVGNALARRAFALAPKDDDKPRTDAVGKNALVIKSQVMQRVEQEYPNMFEAKGHKTRTTKSAQDLAAGIGLHRQTSGKSQLRLA